MSTYQPKHLKDDSIREQIKDAGRKVLYSTMSVILAASLMPISPAMVYAEEGQKSEQTGGSTEGGSSNNNAQQSQEPQEQGKDQSEQQGQGQNQNETQGGQQDQEKQQGQDQQGDNAQKQEGSQGTQQSEKDSSQDDKDTNKGQENNRPSDSENGESEPNESSGNKDKKDERSDAQQEAKNDGTKRTTVLKAQAAEIPTFSVVVPEGAPSQEEGESNTQYVRGNAVLNFNISDGPNLTLVEGAIVTLKGTKDGTDFSMTGVFSLSGSDVATASITLTPGKYQGLLASVTGVKYGDEQKDFAPSSPNELSGTLVVLDASSTTSVSVTVQKGSEDVSTGVEDATPTTAIVLNSDQVDKIRVAVASDALNTSETASYVEAYNDKGDTLGSKAKFVKQADGNYVAELALNDDSGKSVVNGKVALCVVATAYGSEALTKYIAGNATDGKLLANGALIIDADAPVVKSVKAKVKDDPETYADLKTGDDKPDVVANKSEVVVTVDDVTLQTGASDSYVQLVDKDGNEVNGVENASFTLDQSSGLYKATLDTTNVGDGAYQVKVVAKDAFSGSQDATVKDHHEVVEQYFGNLVIDRTAPKIASVQVELVDEGKTKEDLAAGGEYQGNTLIVKVDEAEEHLDTNASYVEVFDANQDSTNPILTYTGTSWDADTKTLTATNIKPGSGSAIPAEGKYRIVVHVQDTAGNIAKKENDEPDIRTYDNVILDAAAPRFGEFAFTEPQAYNEQTVVRLAEGGTTVTLPVTDLSFEANKIQFDVVRDGDKVEGLADGGHGVKLSWEDPKTDTPTTHTAKLSITKPGTYNIRVSGKDARNNAAEEKTITFVVAATPVVEVTHKNAEGAFESIDNTIKDYYNTPQTFKANITGTYIDAENTTIAGVSMSKIMEELNKEGVTSYAPTNSTLTFWGQNIKGVESKYTEYEVLVTYKEGLYNGDNRPIVKAKDWYLVARGDEPVKSKECKEFVVDLTAPTVFLSKTDEAKYVNRDTDEKSAKEGKILFFKTGKLLYTVTDGGSGVASVKLEGGNKEYLGDVKPDENDNDNHVVNLKEGVNFDQAVILAVTDNAGNVSRWSLEQTVKDEFVPAGGSSVDPGEGTIGKNIPVPDSNPPYPDWESGIRTVNGIQRPEILAKDTTPPFLEFVGSKTPQAGKYYNASEIPSLQLSIQEKYFKFLKEFIPEESILRVSQRDNTEGSSYRTFRNIVAKDKSVSGDDPNYTVTCDFLDENGNPINGHYTVEAGFTDLAGNESNEPSIGEFTIDTVAPEATVTFDPAEGVGGSKYYSGTRTATIRVKEHNFSKLLEAKQGERGYFSIVAQLKNGASGTEAPVHYVDDWRYLGNDTYECTMTFDKDGEYTLEVHGEDLAGNKAIINGDKSSSTYTSSAFVIDTQAPVHADVFEPGQAPKHSADPVVEFPAPTGTYGGMNYYSHGISVDARVKDRNFDVDKSQAGQTKDTLGTTNWSLQTTRGTESNDFRDADGFQVYETSVSYPDDGVYFTPFVQAVDLASNTSDNAQKNQQFVVDLIAPTISVDVDRTPTSTGEGNDSGDPIQFFNDATRMTFTLGDNHGLRYYRLDDPEGEYVIDRNSDVEGKTSGSLSISLRDGANVDRDTEYERDIELTVEDLAGNQRVWTIDRTGKVVADKTGWAQNSAANNSINNADVYPVALVQDTTAPVITLSGVEAGQYYNSPQTVHAAINEFNFDYLKRFDASRVIVHVTKYEGSAGRAQSNWTVPASSFNGTRPNYAFDQQFDSDGHYELYAEFLDYANNRSNRASIGEFTVDMTAPVISVTWNNPAGNAPYYRETRVATITVTEHNFDASLFAINTTGSIGGWSTDGDTHTCTVTFDADGRYTLSVSGRDQAGNEAAAYTEPEFTIDKTAPKISFGGRVQRYGVDRGVGSKENEYSGNITDDGQMPSEENPNQTLQDHHAYNGVVMPTIEFVDQTGGGLTNYDGSKSTYTIAGGKHGQNPSKVNNHSVASMAGGEVYQFEDFGLITAAATEGGRNVYDPDADDVYTITASMADMAGNTTTGTVTFSVNRYGSNFIVQAIDENGKTISDADGTDYGIQATAPRLEVHEINVSGSASDGDHSVLKEYANAVTSIDAVNPNDSRGDNGDGYVVSIDQSENSATTKYGWSEYVYNIRRGNFGFGSPSDSGDGGQGVYRVDVTSVDRASNDTSTAEYLDTTEFASKESSKNGVPELKDIADSLSKATASFTLDQVGPAIDEYDVPSVIKPGASYEASLHVSDAITEHDTVRIMVNGAEVQPNSNSSIADDGTGTYKFTLQASAAPFAVQSVWVEVTDTFGRKDTKDARKFLLTVLVPEIAVIGLVAGGITGGVIYYRRRKALAEPDMPGTYE